MAYDYCSQFYNPPRPQMAQSNPGIIWVQGEAGAKAYPVLAGQSILLMDSENAIMYIKSTDMSGMPMPLRIFDYKERTSNKPEPPIEIKTDYITKEEFNKFREEIRNEIRKSRRKNEEPVKESLVA